MVMEPATHRILIVALAIGLVVGLLAPVTSGRASELENSHTGYYLVDMIEQTRASPDFLKIPIFERATGEGAQDIYEIRIPLLKGDLVYLEGQVEVTNLTSTNVMVGVCIRTTEGEFKTKKKISHRSTANVTPEMHHMPLRVSDKYLVDRDEEIIFVISAHAASDSTLAKEKHLQVEQGYGHLLALVYRPR